MKNQIKITKLSIIKKIAKRTDIPVYEIKKVYDAFEDIIFDTLSSTDEENDVCLKLFEGINLNGIFMSEKTKKNNLTGEVKLVESKIKPKFNITRSYCEKLNSK